MKVLLIDPRGKHIPKQEKPGVALNIGLATLASVLLQHDYKISLFDMANHYCNDDSNLIKLLQQEKIDVIGFSILNSQYNNAIETIKKIRKYTRALIVVGGAEATALKEDIIISSDDSIDIVVLGEAEESFLDLLKYVKNHERDKICLVEGIIINRRRMTDVKPKNITQLDDKYIFTGEVGKVKDLDKYPNPNMDIFGISKMSEYKIMASRGCPFKCNFCFTYLGRSNRRRAPSRIVNQLETDYKKFKFEKYRFFDPIFNLKKSWVHDICDKIINSELYGMKWEAVGIRADQMDDDLAQHMVVAGCTRVDIGVESMHPDVYNLIDKGETLDELIHGVQVALRYFQTVSLYIIIGLPGDTMSRSLYTYNEVKKLGRGIGVKNEPIVNYSLAVPYSGTKLKDWAIENARAMKDSHETYTRGSEAMNAGAAYETEDFSSKERLKVYKILQTKEFRYVSVSKIHRYLTPFLWLRDSILYDSSNIMSHLLFIYRRVLNELRGNIRNSSYKEYVEYDRIPDGTWWLDDNK